MNWHGLFCVNKLNLEKRRAFLVVFNLVKVIPLKKIYCTIFLKLSLNVPCKCLF